MEEDEEDDEDDEDEDEENDDDDEEESSMFLFFLFLFHYSIIFQRLIRKKAVVMFVNIVHYSFVMFHLMQLNKMYQMFFLPMVYVVLFPVN